jgi:REP-associated tyrosine transposase
LNSAEKPRSDPPGAVHHVIATGNNRCRIAVDDIDRATFVARMTRVAEASALDIVAWCLMETHVHMLVVSREGLLGRGMGRLLGGHARRFNERHDLEGHLWQQRYYDRAVKDEPHLLKTGLYVVLNPVRAGVCRHPRSYRWCSYAATAAGESSGPFRPDLLLAALDPDRDRARCRYIALVEEEAASIVATRGETALQVPA